MHSFRLIFSIFVNHVVWTQFCMFLVTVTEIPVCIVRVKCTPEVLISLPKSLQVNLLAESTIVCRSGYSILASICKQGMTISLLNWTVYSWTRPFRWHSNNHADFRYWKHFPTVNKVLKAESLACRILELYFFYWLCVSLGR